MRVLNAVPPLFDEIRAVFPLADRPGIVFAFGDTVYVPKPIGTLPREILAHEQIHGDRQLGSAVAGTARGVDAVAVWWQRYLADPEFRLAEELPAHVAEFNSLCEQHRPRWHSERNLRRTMAAHVARKLTAPLYRYGSLITIEKAKQVLLAAA